MSREELERALLGVHDASFGWALHCARFDRSEAEDVLQQAYVKVLDGSARFAGRSTFRTWLFGVIRRTASQRRRARTLRSFLLDRWGSAERHDVRPAEEPLSSIIREADSRALLGALHVLSARQRDLLHLVFYQDLSIEEAARVMGLRLGTARTHYERGKARLRVLLASERGA